MYLAFASAWSSGDLSRQVGASLASEDGDLLALGYNEVPKAGGGSYDGTFGSKRDIELGHDSNHLERERIAKRVAKIAGLGRRKGEQILRQTDLRNLTEFGRAVHAEMDAILSCARTGRSPAGGTLFVTTFPCHNCARHIIAAGIRRVVYVEPYPRSKAQSLHWDAIALGPGPPADVRPAREKVYFQQFHGVGPRRYIDLFAMKFGSGKELKREENGRKIGWQRRNAFPRLQPAIQTFIDRERLVSDEFDAELEKLLPEQ